MTKKRIESRTSCTAEIACLSRAASSHETSSQLRSDDRLAAALLPSLLRVLVRIPLFRLFHRHVFAPAGIYEYVIARTKCIDAVFKRAMAEHFNQVLLLGAGFDTRALRFQGEAQHARVFELDASHTQQAKIRQFQKRHLSLPSNAVFVEIDFDKHPLPEKLDSSGFQRSRRSLFILEGVLMYLEPASVGATLRTIQEYAGAGSWIVFDYVRESVLRQANTEPGEAALVQTVSKAGEQWRFGIEPSKVESFLAAYGFALAEHLDAKNMEDKYFQDTSGRVVRRINTSHCIVLGVRS